MPASRRAFLAAGAAVAAGPVPALARQDAPDAPARTWSRTYLEDTPFGIVRAVVPTDAGFVLAGAAGSDSRGWIAGVDAAGRPRWQRTVGTPSSGFVAAAPTPDGAILAGAANAAYRPSDPRPPDPWLVRVAADGDIAWIRTYQGTTHGGDVDDVVRTPDGYVVAGSLLVDGDERPWVAGLDERGVVRWQWRGAADGRGRRASAVVPLGDGVVVAGSEATGSDGGRAEDAWVARLVDAETAWTRRFAGEAGDRIEALAPAGDGVVALGERGFHEDDEGVGWLAALDRSGSVRWQRRYPREGWDWLHDLAPVGDGHVLVGTRELADGDDRAAWLLRVGPDGRPRWERRYPDGSVTTGFVVLPTADDGLLVGGERRGETEAAWLANVGGEPVDGGGGLDLPSVPGWATPFLAGAGVGAGVAAAAMRWR